MPLMYHINTEQCTWYKFSANTDIAIIIKPTIVIILTNIIQYSQTNTNLAFEKHIKQVHNGTGAKFSMEIIKTFKTPLERQIREGVEISRANVGIILNSKIDHYQPGMRIMTFANLNFDD